MRLEGQHLARYQIVRIIGSGGMGEVYLAEDSRIGQQVAIKVIWTERSFYPNSVAVEEAARLLHREARAIGQLDHPHILPLYDYGEAQIGEAVLVYLVMPYRPEGSLVNWIRQQYPNQLVPPEVVVQLVSQAAEALQHAHDHKIIHQDVKPSNFLIRSQANTTKIPDLLLADFGIAHIAATTASSSQNLRGTPIYMAPEQCLGKPGLASDQYALAVMTYELLTGRPPFQGNAVHLMYQQLTTTPQPPSSLNPRLPRELDAVILNALAKQPEERFASVTAFANALMQAAHHIETITTYVPPTSSIPVQVSTLPILLATPSAPEIFGNEEAHITPPLSAITEDSPTYIKTQQGKSETLTHAIQPTLSSEKHAFDAEEESKLETIEPDTTQGGAELSTMLRLSKATALPDMATGPTATPTKKLEPEHTDKKLPSSVPAISAPPALNSLVRRRRRLSIRQWGLIAAATLLLLVLVLGSLAYVVPGVIPFFAGRTSALAGVQTAATITITPTSKDLKEIYALLGVIGTPDASRQEVQARRLSTTTQIYTRTASATGQGTTQATEASGTLTITNDTGAVIGGFNAGDSFTGKSGVTVILDVGTKNPFYPGGSQTLAAHASITGKAGNIPALDINVVTNQCHAGACATVANNSPFTGGKNSNTYSIVLQSDINSAANSVITANQPDPQQVLQGQIQPNEQIVGKPQCQSNVSSDHSAGDIATQVTASVTFTCTGEVYDKDAALALSAKLLTDQATTDPGTGYALVGTIKTEVTNATLGNQGTVKLTTTAEGVWAYQFSQAQQRTLAKLVAGKSKQEATSLLLKQQGVTRTSIQLSGGIGQTIPSNPAKIIIEIQAVPGA